MWWAAGTTALSVAWRSSMVRGALDAAWMCVLCVVVRGEMGLRGSNPGMPGCRIGCMIPRSPGARIELTEHTHNSSQFPASPAHETLRATPFPQSATSGLYKVLHV